MLKNFLLAYGYTQIIAMVTYLIFYIFLRLEHKDGHSIAMFGIRKGSEYIISKFDTGITLGNILFSLLCAVPIMSMIVFYLFERFRVMYHIKNAIVKALYPIGVLLGLIFNTPIYKRRLF